MYGLAVGPVDGVLLQVLNEDRHRDFGRGYFGRAQ
jgi:hypothetical protein